MFLASQWCLQRLCVLAGGDTFLQICLWEAGHAITSPGAGFYDWQMRSFDAGSEDRMGLVDYVMRAIEGTCHDRGVCNVSHSPCINMPRQAQQHLHCWPQHLDEHASSDVKGQTGSSTM